MFNSLLYRSIPRAVSVALKTSPHRRSALVSNLIPLVGPRASALAPQQLAHVYTNTYDFLFNAEAVRKNLYVDGLEHLETAYRATSRVMIATAHVGFWEIGLSYVVHQGYPTSGLYAPMERGFWSKAVHRHRDPRIHWIPVAPGASRACRQALSEGKILGILADLPFGEAGEPVTIAGHRARLPLGPWHLAIRAQATVVPGFALRESPGRYRIHFHPPFLLKAGTLQEQAHHYLEQYRALLESYLLKYPEQWGVLQPFWESR